MARISHKICLAIILFVIITEFCAQICVIKNVKGRSAVTVIPGILELVYCENAGAAFGIFSGRRILLIVISVLFIAVMIAFLFKKLSQKFLNPLCIICICLIIGGGISNLIERLLYGYVIDYINISFFSPIFNLSDLFISLGMTGFLFFTVFNKEVA